MALFGGNKDENANLVSESPRDQILEKLAFDSLEEKRKTRRWSIFFRSLVALYFLVFLVTLVAKGKDFGMGGADGEHTAIIEITGVIADNGDVDSDVVNEGLRAAFEAEDSVGVILKINSPGGSAVQSGEIFDEVRRLRTEFPEKKLIAVVGDMCASGGYYIASSADEIYANRASLVGSIGVLMNGYGFVDTMKKLGVERRLVTAGENKAMLDPFSPVRPADIERAQKLVSSIHTQFINAVKAGRGDRLKTGDKELFSGMIWTGEQAKGNGLIDDYGDSSYVAREILKAPELVDYSPKPALMDQIKSAVGVEVRSWLGIDAHTRGIQMR